MLKVSFYMVYFGLPVILTCMIAPYYRQISKLPRFYTRSLKMSSHTITTESALSDVVSNAHIVNERIQACAEASGRQSGSVRLVAVSKTKPVEAIQQLYDAGYRHFGENYLQELTEKAAILPKDINWHFIGHLQSSKASKITKDVSNLYLLETIDSEKLANKVNNARGTAGLPPLKVFIQVDTSGEATKSGVDVGPELLSLATFISEQCPHLRLAGLMTIGAPDDVTCFDKLAHSRVEVAELLKLNIDELELSMGMSGDYEAAIQRGATSVRVGSTIFGARLYPRKEA